MRKDRYVDIVLSKCCRVPFQVNLCQPFGNRLHQVAPCRLIAPAGLKAYQYSPGCCSRRPKAAMSAPGHQRRFERPLEMSAMPPIATKSLQRGNRRFGPKAAMRAVTTRNRRESHSRQAYSIVGSVPKALPHRRQSSRDTASQPGIACRVSGRPRGCYNSSLFGDRFGGILAWVEMLACALPFWAEALPAFIFPTFGKSATRTERTGGHARVSTRSSMKRPLPVKTTWRTMHDGAGARLRIPLPLQGPCNGRCPRH